METSMMECGQTTRNTALVSTGFICFLSFSEIFLNSFFFFEDLDKEEVVSKEAGIMVKNMDKEFFMQMTNNGKKFIISENCTKSHSLNNNNNNINKSNKKIEKFCFCEFFQFRILINHNIPEQ